MARTVIFVGLLMIMLMSGRAVLGEESQPFARRMENALDTTGTSVIRLSYPMREGVNAHHRVYYRSDHDEPVIFSENDSKTIFVQIESRSGRIRDIQWWVAIAWRHSCGESGTECFDLGEVDALEASHWFLDLARSENASSIAEDALQAAVLARESDITGPLLEIARDRHLDEDLRQDAVIWLAIFAAEHAAGPLEHMTRAEQESADFRENAVVALSMMDEDKSLPLLMDMARKHKFPEVQQMALIMLAQKESPEVLDLIEEILMED